MGPALVPRAGWWGSVQVKRFQRVQTASPKCDPAPDHSAGSTEPMGFHSCFSRSATCKKEKKQDLNLINQEVSVAGERTGVKVSNAALF